jgi:aspartate carbamoyltransferase catalytic subunit
VPVINAGSGKDQHPSQALLDIYTLRRSFKERGGIDNKKIAFVGDLLRGRTVRSLAYLLTKFQGVKQYFVAPPEFQIGTDIKNYLDSVGTDYDILEDFSKVIPEADAIYMTRLQDEWDSVDGAKTEIDVDRFSITGKELPLLKKDAIILHPLPRRQEIAIEVDADPRALYWQQVRNGMWIRVALIAMTFGIEKDITDYYSEHF